MRAVWGSYRATDTKLRRHVAIKVLPAAFTAEQDRLARFEREAQLLAQLQHPNIASIFGLEESDGIKALVMELVEGPTLAERLEQGPLPLEESLSISLQIIHALEEAHEKGIVHRDLKPQNVKAPVEGNVKVLDFGLAKAMDPAAVASGAGTASQLAASQLAASPTLTLGATLQGVILGTAAYMAPEQAKGMAVDKRADIWAFGVVLYEMLTGVSPFVGDSVPDTLARVLQREIDFAALPATTPPAIHRLLRRCLERNPKRRLHDIADARLVVEDVISGADVEERAAPGTAPLPPPRAGLLHSRLHLAWLAGLVLASAATGLLVHRASRDREIAREPQHLAIQLSYEQELAVGGNSLLAFTPDGRALVFGANIDGRRVLLHRELGSRAATEIPGTDDGEAPFFSPDGSQLGFIARGQLMKVAATGGRPARLAEARGAGGATWLADGSIVVTPIYSDGLFRVSAEGGSLDRLTTPDRAGGVLGHWWPRELPGGRWVIFTAFRTPVDTSRIGAVDLATGEIRWLIDGGFYGLYVPTGHLLYAKGQRLYAVPLDSTSATVLGSAVTVLDDLLVEQTGGIAMVAVSSLGTLAYVSESLGHAPKELVWIDRAGGVTPAAGERMNYVSASLSPDGRRAALSVQGESRDLWILSFERGTLSRLTSGPDTEFDPIWTRDGKELVYLVDRPPFELYRIPTSTPDAGRPVWSETPGLDTTTPSAAPDGRTIVYSLTEEQTGANLYARPIDDDEPARPIRTSRGSEEYPTFSPDGRWLAYESDETGRVEIYVEAFPGPGERFQITADGGREPRWAGNGELFYRRDNDIRVVAVRFAERPQFDSPRTLFQFPIQQSASGGVVSRLYDVAADGQRILAITTPETLRPRQIDVVTDWTRELTRLVPPPER
ncbi:MAG TPA: protein kinase [Thermoanaerobaculia bacterium]|nr:protein kinase [Thermoanaerobaculia bacterium]